MKTKPTDELVPVSRRPLLRRRPRASASRTSGWTARAPQIVAAVTLAALAAACDGHVVLHADPTPPPPPPPPVVWDESEPNDAAWLAPWFGSMYPGESIRVAGYASDDGYDPQDGLAFTGYGPCRIDFRLSVDDPWTDLDVWLYDADFDTFVAAYTLPYGDETGTFWIDGVTNFHLVVVPSYGASWWNLEVGASATGYAGLSSPSALPEMPEALRAYTLQPEEDDDASPGIERTLRARDEDAAVETVRDARAPL